VGVRQEAVRWLADGTWMEPLDSSSCGVSTPTVSAPLGGMNRTVEPRAISRHLMSGMNATDALAAGNQFDPAYVAACWVSDSLMPMFVSFIDGPGAPGASASTASDGDAAADEANDAEGAEVAAAELATMYSFTAGRDAVAQSRLMMVVTDALPRHTEVSGDGSAAPLVGPVLSGDDDDNMRTWRGERALMLFRALLRLGASLGMSPAAAAAAVPTPASAQVELTFASGGVGVGFGVVGGGFDRGCSTPPALAHRADDDEYRWYRRALRLLLRDALAILPAVATAAADVLLLPMDIAAIRDSHHRKRAPGAKALLPAGMEASHRRALGAAAALEAACRWRAVEAEEGDEGSAPLRWEVVVGAVMELVRRLPMQNGGGPGGGTGALGTDAGPAWRGSPAQLTPPQCTHPRVHPSSSHGLPSLHLPPRILVLLLSRLAHVAVVHP